MPPLTDVIRLVDDAGDGCEGLIVDRFGPVLRLEVMGAEVPRGLDEIARALCEEEAGAAAAVALLRAKGGTSRCVPLVGEPPVAHVVYERGRRLLVRTVDEDAPGVGVFVDQREGRRLVEQAARERPGQFALNLFAHAGAFGVFAAAGGASRVDHVDAAKKCAPWAALNLALNGVDPRAHRFVVDDALAFLAKAAQRARKGGPQYGVIVCDPPTTALKPDGKRFHVEKDLPDLARDACAALADGGALLLSTNDRALSVAHVLECAREGARAAKRDVKSVIEVPLPADVTTASDATLRPMRGAWLTLA